MAEKGSATAWPVPAERLSGSLHGRNVPWHEAQHKLARKPLHLQRVAGKLLPAEQAAALQASLGKSPYKDDFVQGATIVPRVFWFVRKVSGRLGVAADAPLLETDEDAVRQAKEPWRALRLRGQVEARFLYGTLPSGDLLPFGHTGLKSVVLPILPHGTRYQLLDVQDARARGFPHLARWLSEAQRRWEQHAARDAKGNLKAPRVVQWVDYRKKLTNQRSDLRYKVCMEGLELISLQL